MGTVIVGGIVLVLVGAAIVKIVRDTKKGKSCTGCSHCGGVSDELRK